jgi:hypothetical protein
MRAREWEPSMRIPRSRLVAPASLPNLPLLSMLSSLPLVTANPRPPEEPATGRG